MDENNIFDSGQLDERPLTSFYSSLAGVSSIGHMDTMIRRRQHIGHCKEGEEFIQNLFHIILPLFSGKEKINLSECWLLYEISKVNKDLYILFYVYGFHSIGSSCFVFY